MNFLQNYAELQNKRIDFTEKYGHTMLMVRFFYIAPPYFQANMGHYGGCTARDFEDLLLTLSGIKGKFLLSSYPSELLAQYVAQNRWHSVELAAAYQLQRTKHHSKSKNRSADSELSVMLIFNTI